MGVIARQHAIHDSVNEVITDSGVLLSLILNDII